METPITPVSESTTKVQQQNLAVSIRPSAPSRFPINYADNQWDIAVAGSALAQLAESVGSFDQHSLNELFAYILLQLLSQPSHHDFAADFSSDFY